MDHRQGIRHPASGKVEIHSWEGRSSGIVRDISSEGMFVLSQARVAVNENVEIFLLWSGNNTRIPGMVVHCHEQGFGLIFRDLEDTIRSSVIDFIQALEGMDRES